MIFRTIATTFHHASKQTKQTFFSPPLTPLFTFKVWGISHFTPLPMGEGSGEGLVGFVSLVSLGWLVGVVGLPTSPPTPSANVLSHHDTALPVGSRGLLLPAS